jgi:hypothetical protein
MALAALGRFAGGRLAGYLFLGRGRMTSGEHEYEQRAASHEPRAARRSWLARIGLHQLYRNP